MNPATGVQAVDSDASGAVYVVAGEENQIIKIYPFHSEKNREEDSILTIGGKGISGERFNHPAEIDAKNRQKVYVLDSGNKRIVILDDNLKYLNEINFSVPESQVKSPVSFSVNANDEIFVLDEFSNKVSKFTSRGEFVSDFGGYDYGEGSLVKPDKILCGGSEYVYVLDQLREPENTVKPVLKKFDRNGTYISTCGFDFFSGDSSGWDNFSVDEPHLILYHSGNVNREKQFFFYNQRLSTSAVLRISFDHSLHGIKFKYQPSGTDSSLGLLYLLSENGINLYSVLHP